MATVSTETRTILTDEQGTRFTLSPEDAGFIETEKSPTITTTETTADAQY